MQEEGWDGRRLSCLLKWLGMKGTRVIGLNRKWSEKTSSTQATWPLPVRPTVWSGPTDELESCQLRFGAIQIGSRLILG